MTRGWNFLIFWGGALGGGCGMCGQCGNLISYQAAMADGQNLWPRKCVRRAIFRNIEVRVEEGELCHCATCQVSSYTKNEYSLFIRNLMLNIFLFNNFFEKSCCSRRERS